MSALSPLQIHRVITQPFGSNTYLLTRTGIPSSLLIDPGEGSERLLAGRADQNGGRVEYVVLTHEHFDHMAGLTAARLLWGCRLICSQACSEAACDPTRNFSRYLVQRDIVCEPADLSCEEAGWELQWNGARLRFIPTPGHSPGSICISVDGFLFTGDTLLPGVKPVTRIPGGNKKALEQSLANLYSSFPPDTVFYPGHGEPCPLGLAFQQSKEPAFANAT